MEPNLKSYLMGLVTIFVSVGVAVPILLFICIRWYFPFLDWIVRLAHNP